MFFLSGNLALGDSTDKEEQAWHTLKQDWQTVKKTTEWQDKEQARHTLRQAWHALRQAWFNVMETKEWQILWEPVEGQDLEQAQRVLERTTEWQVLGQKEQDKEQARQTLKLAWFNVMETKRMANLMGTSGRVRFRASTASCTASFGSRKARSASFGASKASFRTSRASLGTSR